MMFWDLLYVFGWEQTVGIYISQGQNVCLLWVPVKIIHLN